MTDSRLLRSFIPPYILNRIIAHGSEPQRNAAMQTLNHVRSLLPNPRPSFAAAGAGDSAGGEQAWSGTAQRA